MTIHVVQQGENLQNIAAFYGVDAVRLALDNAVPADGALAVGQTLVIRFPSLTHTVRGGETLTGIAAAYGLTVREVWRRNWFLGGGASLTPGQNLIITYQDEPSYGPAAFNGYAYPFIDSTLLNAQLPYLTYMTPFTYGISADGELLPLESGNMLRAARLHGTQSVMHLSTLTEDGSFNTARGEIILTQPDIQARLIEDVLEHVEQLDYAGVDVDFEYLPGYLAEAYAEFLARLRGLLRMRRKFLWAALAPKTYANQPGLLYEAHSYFDIGRAVDAVLLMTYEWGYTYGPPMAVSPVSGVRAVLDYAVTEIPPGQIFLGLSNYGYDWPLPYIRGVTRAQSISNQRAIETALQYNIAIQYDETAQAPFFHYTDENGIVHEVWFEDARSLSVRFGLIAEYGLQGGGYWNLMRPFSQTWILADALYDIV